MRSYCTTCDAPESTDCGHDALRYLDPIMYEKDPVTGALEVPDHERERWDNPVTVVRPRGGEAKDIQRLCVELDEWIFLGKPLEERLRSAYAAQPVKITRLVENVVDGARTGRLRSPAALLAKELRQAGY